MNINGLKECFGFTKSIIACINVLQKQRSSRVMNREQLQYSINIKANKTVMNRFSSRQIQAEMLHELWTNNKHTCWHCTLVNMQLRFRTWRRAPTAESHRFWAQNIAWLQTRERLITRICRTSRPGYLPWCCNTAFKFFAFRPWVTLPLRPSAVLVFFINQLFHNPCSDPSVIMHAIKAWCSCYSWFGPSGE